ncbi:glutamine synthetase [Xylaria sp. FL1042]|nr:glutamine synthetase [Xylaria sp. FL1042]
MSEGEKKLKEFLETNSIKTVRLQWVDYSGVLRARFIPAARALRVASGSETVRLGQSSMLVPISTAPKFFSLSDYHETWTLTPDWSSIRRCGFKPDHAAIMCYVTQEDADKEFDKKLDKCPRMLLTRALDQLKAKWHAKVWIGFEIEFVLLDSSNKVIEPVDRLTGHSSAAGLRAGMLDLIEEIVDALEKSSIEIHHYHAKLNDQMVIALAPERALKAVDSLVLAQETIRTICVRRNLKATMTPKPTLAGPSNGLHLHLSFYDPKDLGPGSFLGGCPTPELYLAGIANRLGGLEPDRVSPDTFIAAILSHMGSLCAFGMANYDGYVRSASGAAGAWIGFGTDNRDLPVRKIGECLWEFRMMDGTANPYLFVAAVIFAALDGLGSKTKLVWKDCKFFPDSMNEERRVEYGLTKSMPITFKEALDYLRSDHAMTTRIGQNLVEWFLSVKDKEVEEFGKMTDEQRRLRFLEYF